MYYDFSLDKEKVQQIYERMISRLIPLSKRFAEEKAVFSEVELGLGTMK